MKSSVARTAMRALSNRAESSRPTVTEIGIWHPILSNLSQLPCQLDEGYLLTVILFLHSISSHR